MKKPDKKVSESSPRKGSRNKGGTADNGKSAPRKKKPGQNELFSPDEIEKSKEQQDIYEVDYTGIGEQDANRRGSLKPSSRATRLLAMKAAEEALTFSGKKSSQAAEEKKTSTKTGKVPRKTQSPKSGSRSPTAGKQPSGSRTSTRNPVKKQPQKTTRNAAGNTVKSTAKTAGPVKRKRPSGQKQSAGTRKKSRGKRVKRRELVIFGITALFLVASAVTITILILNRDNDNGSSIRNYSDAYADTNKGLIAYIDTETPFANEIRVYIKNGMRADDVCRLLDQAGVVSSSGRLQNYMVSHNLDTKIQSGPIFLPLDMKVEDAAVAITRGYWEHPIVFIYDGFTLDRIDSLLVSSGLSRDGDFIRAAEKLASEKGIGFAEGYFYPDEYILNTKTDAAATLAAQMYDRFLNIAGPLETQLDISGRTLEQAVIVASMIQRETANPDEMPLIAGIIWKRLDEGIPLGIDATTRYEIDDWTNPLTSAVLENPTPYNTRRRRGLPPTGISNPGFEALQAAAYPEQSPYYYYLHDRSAQIHFAITYDEHLSNVREYLR